MPATTQDTSPQPIGALIEASGVSFAKIARRSNIEYRRLVDNRKLSADEEQRVRAALRELSGT